MNYFEQLYTILINFIERYEDNGVVTCYNELMILIKKKVIKQEFRNKSIVNKHLFKSQIVAKLYLNLCLS